MRNSLFLMSLPFLILLQGCKFELQDGHILRAFTTDQPLCTETEFVNVQHFIPPGTYEFTNQIYHPQDQKTDLPVGRNGKIKIADLTIQPNGQAFYHDYTTKQIHASELRFCQIQSASGYTSYFNIRCRSGQEDLRSSNLFLRLFVEKISSFRSPLPPEAIKSNLELLIQTYFVDQKALWVASLSKTELTKQGYKLSDFSPEIWPYHAHLKITDQNQSMALRSSLTRLSSSDIQENFIKLNIGR